METVLEIRVGLAVPLYDEKGGIIAPPLELDIEDLCPARITQLTHIKLILTSMAKDKKASKA